MIGAGWKLVSGQTETAECPGPLISHLHVRHIDLPDDITATMLVSQTGEYSPVGVEPLS